MGKVALVTFPFPSLGHGPNAVYAPETVSSAETGLQSDKAVSWQRHEDGGPMEVESHERHLSAYEEKKYVRFLQVA